MIAHGPDKVPHPAALAVTPDLAGISRAMETFAAAGHDGFMLKVSQLLSAISTAVRDDEPPCLDELEWRCHSIAFAWLLQQLDAARTDES
jgi:hypothetical protein